MSSNTKPKNYFEHCFLPVASIVAPHRAKRPHEYGNKNKIKECPFCPGNEKYTSTEIARIGSKEEWFLRIVKNKFPIIDEKYGVHEVIIEHREHNKRFADFGLEELRTALNFALQRKAEVERQKEIRYVALIKNAGKNTGASLMHEHSQLIGLKFVPRAILEIQKRFNEFKEKHSCCPLCKEIKEACIVFENKHALAIVPKAQRLEYELHITTKRHVAKFSEIKDVEIEAIAAIMKKALQRLKKEDIGYNLLYYDAISNNDFHAFISLLPRKQILGAQEFLTSITTITNNAEEVKKFYREAI